jgi:hypothetical protein
MIGTTRQIGTARRAVLIAAGVLAAAVGVTAAAPETFTATANVRKSGISATAPVTVNVTKYATDAERTAASAAVKQGGTKALQTLLASKPEVGVLQLGEKRTPIKMAIERASGGGRLITVITSEPILHLGEGVPESSPVSGYDLALATFEVQPSGAGVGDLSPAAKVTMDAKGAFVVDDYGKAVVWLNNIAVKK